MESQIREMISRAHRIRVIRGEIQLGDRGDRAVVLLSSRNLGPYCYRVKSFAGLCRLGMLWPTLT